MWWWQWHQYTFHYGTNDMFHSTFTQNLSLLNEVAVKASVDLKYTYMISWISIHLPYSVREWSSTWCQSLPTTGMNSYVHTGHREEVVQVQNSIRYHENELLQLARLVAMAMPKGSKSQNAKTEHCYYLDWFKRLGCNFRLTTSLNNASETRALKNIRSGIEKLSPWWQLYFIFSNYWVL